MRQTPPLGLRLMLALLAVIAAAGIGYVVYNADKYLFDTGRWLILGGGTILAALALGLAFRWRAFATYLALTAMSTLVAIYGAEITLRLTSTPAPPVNAGPLSEAKAAELIWAANREGRRLRPLRSNKAIITADAEGRYHSRIRIRQSEIMKLGGPSNTKVLIPDPVALKWIEVATDRYGHLNEDFIWQQSPIDVLVVGASNTKGSGARYGHDFVSLLKNKNR